MSPAELANVAISLIREMELPLAITFNRGRMMLLPPTKEAEGRLRRFVVAPRLTNQASYNGFRNALK